MDPFALLEHAGTPRCFLLSDRGSGLRAVIVIDDLTLGPGAGGIRTRPYESTADAIEDAAALARAMTLKCALAGLPTGGAKGVVIEHPGLRRKRAFEVLGERVEELGGLFRTAGDLGTTQADLEAMARFTGYVHTDEKRLSAAAGRGLVRCIEVCAERHGDRGVRNLRVLVQGSGAIGAACASALASAGAEVLVSDLDEARAQRVAAAVGGDTVAPDAVWTTEVDVIAPCAVGGVIDATVARNIPAWAICGAANNILADPEAGRILARRGVLHVPDAIASAGAVIAGIARTVMGLDDASPLVDRLGETAREVLDRARRTGRSAPEVAEEVAYARLGISPPLAAVGWGRRPAPQKS